MKKKKKSKKVSMTQQTQKQKVIINVGTRTAFRNPKKRRPPVPQNTVYRVTPVAQPNFQSIGDRIAETAEMNRLATRVKGLESNLLSAREATAGTPIKEEPGPSLASLQTPARPLPQLRPTNAEPSDRPNLDALERVARAKLKVKAGKANTNSVILTRPKDDNFKSMQEYQEALKSIGSDSPNMQPIRRFMARDTAGQRDTFAKLFETGSQSKLD